jgi:ElaB/YqjD/DUF883 family membrane-anchored ribosome-binding protein
MVTEAHEKSKSSHGADASPEDMEALKQDLTQLKDDVVHLFTRAFGLGKNSLGSVGENAHEAMEHLKHRVEELRKRGSDTVHAAGKKIEEKPIQSALIAFGIGFIVAKLLHRRH